MIHELTKSSSVLNNFLIEMRDSDVQKDRMRFRRNMERVGEIIAYEISKTLSFTAKEITTPLAEMEIFTTENDIVISTILRAGLPLQQGILNYFDNAECAFISAFRKYITQEDFEVEVEYVSSPSIDGKVLILCDPMIATGTSMVLACKAMLGNGKPKEIHVVTAIASKQGLTYARQHLPRNVHIWVGAIDKELTAKSYIVPGLGDAGDLAFGAKD